MALIRSNLKSGGTGICVDIATSVPLANTVSVSGFTVGEEYLVTLSGNANTFSGATIVGSPTQVGSGSSYVYRLYATANTIITSGSYFQTDGTAFHIV